MAAPHESIVKQKRMTLPNAALPVDRPLSPTFAVPAGACDAHVHMVANAEAFPLWEGRVENPAPGPTFYDWLQMFERHLAVLGMARTVFVHSILYGGDNSVTIEAVRHFGDRARGVGLLPDDATDKDIDRFAAVGIKALRLNYVHGGILTWEGAKAHAPALAARDMHLQMLAHADRHIADIAEDVRTLPCPVVFDHCGWPADDLSPKTQGFRALCDLVAEGHAYVKLSAVYRLAADWTHTAPLVEALVKANPERCLWGSDWPHIMLGTAAQPDAGALLNAFGDTVTDEATRRRILVTNPETLFGF